MRHLPHPLGNVPPVRKAIPKPGGRPQESPSAPADVPLMSGESAQAVGGGDTPHRGRNLGPEAAFWSGCGVILLFGAVVALVIFGLPAIAWLILQPR